MSDDSKTNRKSHNGGCTCGSVRYEITTNPIVVHCCHCYGCQQNSGSAFAMNALIEADRVRLLAGEIETITVPTPSGTGQDITRCDVCKVAVWSNYNMGGPLRKYVHFIRVGTLDEPDQFPPDVHIFTCSKQPWVILPPEDKQADIFYEREDVFSPESIRRMKDLERLVEVVKI